MRTDYPRPPQRDHNGGAPLNDEPDNRQHVRRGRGRPTIATPERVEALLCRVSEGVPLRLICRDPKMPARSTVAKWRKCDTVFSRQFDLARNVGRDRLADEFMHRFQVILDGQGPRAARKFFWRRRWELARQDH